MPLIDAVPKLREAQAQAHEHKLRRYRYMGTLVVRGSFVVVVMVVERRGRKGRGSALPDLTVVYLHT